jgi:CIC family chloride channel protein
LTIGSGGSAGREGPTAQISAGFGSWLAGVLRLDDHDRRVAEAAGIGAGIGAIFKAPFGGALLSAEILYKRDFEVDAIFPAFIASVIGFAIYGAWAGWTPIFGPGNHFEFTHPASLVGYLLLGLCAGLVGLLYPKALYGLRDLFKRIALPNFLKPALGGLLVGLICLVFPQALGMGYGYVQFGIAGDFLHLAAWLMLALVAVKIVATGLTIGSGGSGGVFGPGMVIGGFLGGALWAGLHTVAPELVTGTNAGAFVVVGMGAFFGGIAKAPLAVILMVAEMTGEYALIAPAMLATMVAYLVSGETSIYESQVPTRLDSPAHRDDHALLLLQTLSVRDALDEQEQEGRRPIVAAQDTPLTVLSGWVSEHHLMSIPVIDGERLVGQVTVKDIARASGSEARSVTAREIMSRPRTPISEDESLYHAWLRMSRRRLRQLVIVQSEHPTHVVGVVTMSAITDLLQPLKTKTLVRKRQRAAPQSGNSGASQVVRTTDASVSETPDEVFAADERAAGP